MGYYEKDTLVLDTCGSVILLIFWFVLRKASSEETLQAVGKNSMSPSEAGEWGTLLSPPLGVLSHFSHIWLYEILWTVACQALLSMGFSRQEYWSGSPCPPPGNLPDPRIEPGSPTLQSDSLPSEPVTQLGKAAVISHCESFEDSTSLGDKTR